jgi:hypothetical protein
VTFSLRWVQLPDSFGRLVGHLRHVPQAQGFKHATSKGNWNPRVNISQIEHAKTDVGGSNITAFGAARPVAGRVAVPCVRIRPCRHKIIWSRLRLIGTGWLIGQHRRRRAS